MKEITCDIIICLLKWRALNNFCENDKRLEDDNSINYWNHTT